MQFMQFEKRKLWSREKEISSHMSYNFLSWSQKRNYIDVFMWLHLSISLLSCDSIILIQASKMDHLDVYGSNETIINPYDDQGLWNRLIFKSEDHNNDEISNITQ